MNTATDDPRPPAASSVALAFEAGGRELRLTLAELATRLARRPATSAGFGSQVWRFSPEGLVEGREPAPGDRLLALKWVGTDDDVRRAWLPREHQWLRRLEGSSVPRALAHGLVGDRAYILLSEWIDGRNLALEGPAIVRDLIAGGRFDPFCATFLRLGGRLREAWVVHGDIQESNVIVRDLQPVLIDFGWARPAGTPPARTNMHEPDDDKALVQLLLRLGSLRRLLLPLTKQEAAEPESGYPSDAELEEQKRAPAG